MKIAMWKLTAGNQPFQETEDEKKKKGLEYIAKLQSDGEKIIEIKEENGYLKIMMEDGL